MKVLVVFLACAVFTASAGLLDICDYNARQMSVVTACMEHKASLRLKGVLLSVRTNKNCLTDTCLFRKICALEGDLEYQLQWEFASSDREELYEVAEQCSL